MNTVAEDRVSFTIRNFFSWFRQRRANAEALPNHPPPQIPNGRPSFVPDQHVLIGAGLDALATAWGETFAPDARRGGERWQRFLLETTGPSLFGRIAAPLLVDALVKDKLVDEAVVVRRVVRDERHSGTVRFPVESDPMFDDFMAHREIVPLKLDRRWERGSAMYGGVERFRFGEVLYKEYRCHWVHRMYASSALGPSDMDDRIGWADLRNRVRYHNISTIRGDRLIPHRRPIFSIPWLLATYDAALDAFEARCLAEHREPVQDEEEDGDD
jgi:hypothetical protein